MTSNHSYQRTDEIKTVEEAAIERRETPSPENYSDKYNMRQLRGMYKLSRPSNNGPHGVL